MRNKTIIILALFLFGFDQVYCELNQYNVDNNPIVSGTLTIQGNVISKPLKLFPPNPQAYPATLGDIAPGETKTFTNKILFFGVEGSIGYKVEATISMELEQQKVHITPRWEIQRQGNMFGEFEALTLSNPLTTTETFSNSGGVSFRTFIDQMYAEPGAPHGPRVFIFSISCVYVE